MVSNPGLLRRVVAALVSGRQRTAQRYVDAYVRDHYPPSRTER